MSEAPDPLEAELSALRPQEISPELRRRVAQRLADAPPGRSPVRGGGVGWGRWLALAGGLAAACLAAILFWWAAGRRADPDSPVIQPQPAPPALAQDAEPTLLTYQRALARSPEALDALLSQQAPVAPETNPEPVRIRAFTRSDATLHALLGED
jgi:hypothetical protein